MRNKTAAQVAALFLLQLFCACDTNATSFIGTLRLLFFKQSNTQEQINSGQNKLFDCHGTQYNTKKLSQHTLTIDTEQEDQDFLLIDGKILFLAKFQQTKNNTIEKKIQLLATPNWNKVVKVTSVDCHTVKFALGNKRTYYASSIGVPTALTDALMRVYTTDPTTHVDLDGCQEYIVNSFRIQKK